MTIRKNIAARAFDIKDHTKPVSNSPEFFILAAKPFCSRELIKYDNKPFPTSNCCGCELVERHVEKLRWAYCRRCPHKIAPAPAPVYNDSRDGSAA